MAIDISTPSSDQSLQRTAVPNTEALPLPPRDNSPTSGRRWELPKARRGIFSRMKSIALSPFRRMAKSLIRKLGRKYRFEIMYGLLLSQYATACVYVAAKLGIADLLKESPRTNAELAEMTDVDEVALNRVMRALATLQVFRKESDDRYTLSSLGETLLTDSAESIHDWSIVCGEVLMPSIPNFCTSVITGDRAFDNTFGMPLWEFFSKEQELGKSFDRAMSSYTDKMLPGIVAACDLSESKVVADIGGGRGALITALLAANPHLQGILYDRAEVTDESQRRIEAAGLSERCKAVSGSFLESIPKEADTYTIKHVLHDWDDDGVRTIFRNIRAAMSEGDRLLILEMMTEHREFGRDFACKWYDFVQMCGPGGRERTADEFDQLLAEAGLELCNVSPTDIWDVTILEARIAAV